MVYIDNITVVRQNNLETKGTVTKTCLSYLKSMKGESIMINNVKKVIVLLLVAAVVSLGLTGCKHKNEQPTEGTPASEHPASEHPSSEHPAKEAPAEEKEAEEQPAGEHPSAEHPTGEHPK